MSIVIITARGPSANRLGATLAAHPGARLWSLNGRHGVIDELGLTPELQFEIHAPRPINSLLKDVPAIISPFATLVRPGEFRFPLAEAVALGAPYFEATFDYMIAFALLGHLGRLPPELSAYRLPLTAILLSGVDCIDSSHFHLRGGASFWLGVARGLGVAIELPPECAILARRDFPHKGTSRPLHPFYGQPPALVEPWLAQHSAPAPAPALSPAPHV